MKELAVSFRTAIARFALRPAQAPTLMMIDETLNDGYGVS